MSFNIYKHFENRPLSWSQLSCFDNPDYPQYGDPEKWYQRYIIGIKDPPSRELIFGSMIDKRIQEDPTFLPELERYPIQQFEIRATYKKIKMVGFADHWDGDTLRLKDDKTGKTAWTKKRADKTGQLTMYLMMLYLKGIPVTKVQCQVDWMPTTQNADLSIDFAKPFKLQSFKTKRTMGDILKFMSYLLKTVDAMQKYVDKKVANNISM